LVSPVAPGLALWRPVRCAASRAMASRPSMLTLGTAW